MIHSGVSASLMDSRSFLSSDSCVSKSVRKVGVGQHLFDILVELVGFHELVVEVERHREPVGDGARREAQRSQDRYIRCFDPERVPVLEADVAERSDAGDGEVTFGCLGLGGSGTRA